MPLLIFVRHGETTANRDRHFGVSEDVQLTELGEQQAHELALRLTPRFRPQRLFSSKYARALRTSQILGQKLGLDVEVLHGIHERDFGYLKGLTYDHIPLIAYEDPSWRPEGGESRHELQQRVLAALHESIPRCTEEEILVVCHGAVIQSIWAHVTGRWKDAHMPANCGALIVRYEAGKLEYLEIFE